MIRLIIAVLAAAIVVISLTGCTPGTSEVDVAQSKETAARMSEAFKQTGMPDITRWSELKMARDILELRDKEITTYLYIVNLDGDLIYLGEAIGYGLPYSVQFTNPERIVWKANVGGFAMPQPDPNGLFMPEGLSATWVLLKGPDGKARPVYLEPEIIVSPFKLHAEKIES